MSFRAVVEISEAHMDVLGEWLPPGPEVPSNALASVRSPGTTPVVVDFGSAETRIGLASQPKPAHSFLTRAARFRDRKSSEQRAVVGNDVLLEQGARNAARSPFDGPLLTNWDAAEAVLDYGLNLIGYSLDAPSPIAISEPLLAPHLPHKTMQELLFEGYAAPRVAFGADVLGAANYIVSPPATKGDALLVFVGAETMHVLPVVNKRPLIEDSRRINWGGKLAVTFLHELLVMKYPNFPVPVSPGEVEQMLRKHCFVARDYREAVRGCMDVTQLAKLERRIQAPVPEHQPLDTERLERQAERRRESGKRLQEQAAVARAERQERQEHELEQLKTFEAELSALPAEVAQAHAHTAGFKDLVDVRRTVRQLNNSLRRARGEQIEDPEPDTPLLNVPDAELDTEQIKEKRRQKLLRASYDARQRVRAAKEAQRQAEAAAEAAESEWRERDLRGWARAKREELNEVLTALREREKLRRDPRLRFRQTLVEFAPEPKRRTGSVRPSPAPPAAASAPASIANPADSVAGNGTSPVPTTIKSEMNGSESVNEVSVKASEFDDDEEDEVEERDLDADASMLKALLLEFDPEFTLEDLGPRKNWHDSVVHKFLWGAHELDSENIAQQYQLNLNIERMRAVEPIFQPSIAGIDQAGLSEVVSDILRRFPQLAANVRVSGGFARLQGLTERLETDLRRDLPVDVQIHVEAGNEPELDAWRGIAKWSLDEKAYVTRKEYDEFGSEYIKEHTWGNPLH